MADTVWVTPRIEHQHSSNFDFIQKDALRDVERFTETIYICKVTGGTRYFSLVSKEITQHHQNFKDRIWQVIAIIL